MLPRSPIAAEGYSLCRTEFYKSVQLAVANAFLLRGESESLDTTRRASWQDWQ
jgi:hypothetical protein